MMNKICKGPFVFCNSIFSQHGIELYTSVYKHEVLVDFLKVSNGQISSCCGSVEAKSERVVLASISLVLILWTSTLMPRTFSVEDSTNSWDLSNGYDGALRSFVHCFFFMRCFEMRVPGVTQKL